MGGNTLPNAYETTIKVENVLIQGGKLAPRPPIPLFLYIPTSHPTIAPIPTTSTRKPSVVSPIDSTSSSGMDKIEAMM